MGWGSLIAILLIAIVGFRFRDRSWFEMPATLPDAPVFLVDLNQATSAELQALPAVGTTLAQRIVAYRSRSGGFQSVEELVQVNGIGAATLERIREFVAVMDDGT